MVRYWCRLIDGRNRPYTFDGVIEIKLLDDTRSSLDKIHDRHPAIIEWYSDDGRKFPGWLKYHRDTTPWEYANFDSLKKAIDDYRESWREGTLMIANWRDG